MKKNTKTLIVSTMLSGIAYIGATTNALADYENWQPEESATAVAKFNIPAQRTISISAEEMSVAGETPQVIVTTKGVGIGDTRLGFNVTNSTHNGGADGTFIVNDTDGNPVFFKAASSCSNGNASASGSEHKQPGQFCITAGDNTMNSTISTEKTASELAGRTINVNLVGGVWTN